MNNFQREGSISNTHVGKAFEDIASDHFLSLSWKAEKEYPLPIGFAEKKKIHRFDIGGFDAHGREFVVECKSHKWTSGENVPIGKLHVWNEAMLYFSLLSADIRKIFFVLRDFLKRRDQTLADYYIKTYPHLIPNGVEIIEYNETTNTAKTILK